MHEEVKETDITRSNQTSKETTTRRREEEVCGASVNSYYLIE
jgi:hypothetical protein